MIRRTSDGQPAVFRVTCDFPGCRAAVDVIAEWSAGAKAEARRRGWQTHAVVGSALVSRQLCPAHKEASWTTSR